MRQTTIALTRDIDERLEDIRFNRRFPSKTSTIEFVLRQGLDALARNAIEGVPTAGAGS